MAETIKFIEKLMFCHYGTLSNISTITFRSVINSSNSALNSLAVYCPTNQEKRRGPLSQPPSLIILVILKLLLQPNYMSFNVEKHYHTIFLPFFPIQVCKNLRITLLHQPVTIHQVLLTDEVGSMPEQPISFFGQDFSSFFFSIWQLLLFNLHQGLNEML